MHLEFLYPLQNFQIDRIYRDDSGSIVLRASSQTTWAVCPYLGMGHIGAEIYPKEREKTDDYD